MVGRPMLLRQAKARFMVIDDPFAIPKTTGQKFYRSAASRPMLARDANAIYWMSRYVERAEHVARLLLVNANVLIDVGDLNPEFQHQHWMSLLDVIHGGELPESGESMRARIQKFMAFSSENPNSIRNCIARARENARGIRESISGEMWECLNGLYWSLQSQEAVVSFEESVDDFYYSIISGSLLFQGMTDQTVSHDQRWQFTQIAKYFERTDVTCRVLETKSRLLQNAEASLEAPIRNIHWMAVLRSCSSIEAFRGRYFGDMDPLRIASFLILEPDFPRSIKFSVRQARQAITEIRREVNPRGLDPAERILGRLEAQLEYTEMSEILVEGLPAFLTRIRMSIAEAAVAIQKAYFLL
jgi:uncharacterized alpha-E superfamily protein